METQDEELLEPMGWETPTTKSKDEERLKPTKQELPETKDEKLLEPMGWETPTTKSKSKSKSKDEERLKPTKQELPETQDEKLLEPMGWGTPTSRVGNKPVIAPTTETEKPGKLWVTISPARSKQLLETLKTQSSFDEYTSRPTGPIGHALTSVLEKVAPESWGIKANEAPPKDYREWFDPTTNKVDWNVLRSYGIPQAVKRGIATSAIKNMIDMPSEDSLNKGVTTIVKESDPIHTRMQKWALQAADATVGNLPSSIGNLVFSDRDTFNPSEVLSREEMKQIQAAHAAKKAGDLSLGMLKVTIDPKKTLDQNLLDASSEKVGYARDLLFDATQNGLINDATLVANLIPAVAGSKMALTALGEGSKILKGARAVSAVMNPVTTAMEAASPAVRARTLAGAALRTGGAAIEGAAIQPIAQSQTGRENWAKQAVIGATLSGAMGAGGEVLAAGMDKIHRASINKQLIESNKKVSQLAEQGVDLNELADGKLDIPMSNVDKIVARSHAVAKVAGVTPDADALSITEAVFHSSKAPEVRAEIDKTLLPLGTSVLREKHILDMQKVIKEVRGGSDLAGANAGKVVEDLEKAIGLTAEIKGKDGFSYDDIEIHRFPSADADPTLVHAINSDSDTFRATLQERYPDVARVYDKVSGQTDMDFMYQKMMVKSLRNILPDDASNIASDVIKDANASRVIAGLDHWFRTEASDVTSAQRAVRSIATVRSRMVEIGSELSQAVESIRQRFIGPNTTGAVHAEGEVPKTPIGNRRMTPEQISVARNASERLTRAVEQSIETGAPLNLDVLTQIKTQLGRMGLKEELLHVEGLIGKFNDVQEKMVERQSALSTIIQKRNYAGQKRQKIRKMSDAEFTLDTIYSSVDNIDARMHEAFTRILKTRNVDLPAINPVLELIPSLSEHMRAGKEIPSELIYAMESRLDRFVETRKAGNLSPKFTIPTGEFKEMLELYNRQVHALSVAKAAALESLNDSSKAAQVALTVTHLSEIVRNPVLMDQLEMVQAISATSLSKMLAGVDIPDKAKQNLVMALTGSNLVNMEMFVNGVFTFQTHSHMLNLFESSKYFTKSLLDRIDDLNREVLGKPLDREMFLGYFCNPLNLNDRSRTFEAMLVDAARLKHYSEKWSESRERSANRAYKDAGVEYIETKITSDTALAMTRGIDSLQEQVRIAEASARSSFGEDIRKLYRSTFRWSSPAFSLAYWKLSGSNGLSRVGEFFYGTDRSKGWFKTEVGDAWHRITTTPEYWKEAKYALASGTLDDFQKLYMGLLGPKLDPATEAKHLQASEGLYQYFKDSRITKMSSDHWKGVWEASETINNLRLKVWKETSRILAKNNEKFANTGIRVPSPEWRTFYVPVPKKRSAMDFDAFQVSSFKDFEIGRYFGSSDEGQMAKADGIQLGINGKTDMVTEYDRPEMDFYKYMRGNISDAETVHIRTKLEQHASLIKDLGYADAAQWITGLTRGSNMGSIHQGALSVAAYLRNPFELYAKIPSLGFTFRILAGIVGHFDAPILALSNIKALAKNVGQQAIRSGVAEPNPFLGALRATQTITGTVFNLANPWRPMKNTSPVMSRIATEYLKGLSDTAELEFRQLFAAVMERSAVSSGTSSAGSRVTSILAEMYLKSIDVITQQFKERTELAMSRTTTQIGARVYEEMLNTIQTEGAGKAYEFLMNRLQQKGKSTLWEIVRKAEEGIDVGNPYIAAHEFLALWHQSRVGRFGALAVPPRIAALAPVLPQTTRFFAARMQNVFAAAESITSAGEVLGDTFRNRFLSITDHHPDWKGIPRQQRLRGLMVVANGLGVAAVIKGLELGYLPSLFGDPDSVEESAKGIHTDGWWETAKYNLKHGTGIDLSDLNLIRWDDVTDPKKLLLGYTATRGGMFISPGAAEAIKNALDGLRYLEDSMGWDIPLIETRMSKAKARIDAMRGTELEIKQLPDWHNAVAEYADAKEIFTKTMGIRMLDFMVSGIPGVNLLPDHNMLGDPKVYAGYLASVGVEAGSSANYWPKVFQVMSSHPFIWAYVLANSSSVGANDVANWVTNYTGPLTDLYDLGHNKGLQNIESLSKYEREMLKNDYLEQGYSEEEANTFVLRDARLRDVIVEADQQLNMYTHQGLREDTTKGLREATMRRLYPAEPFAEKAEDVEFEKRSPDEFTQEVLLKMIPRGNFKPKARDVVK